MKTSLLTATLALAPLAALAKVVHHHQPAAPPPSDLSSTYLGFGFWVVCILAAGFIAYKRHDNAIGAAFAGALLGLILLPFGVLIAALLPRTGSARGIKRTPKQVREVGAKLALIQAGRLTPFVPSGVLPMAGEQFFWEQKARYGSTQTQRVTRGASPALYVPLGHGYRARMGGWRGSSQTISNFMWGPLGMVYVSNLRLVFKSESGDVANIPYGDIITYDCFPDGLSINVPKLHGLMQFRTGDECLGTVFLKMVNGPSKNELTPTQQ